MCLVQYTEISYHISKEYIQLKTHVYVTESYYANDLFEKLKTNRPAAVVCMQV